MTITTTDSIGSASIATKANVYFDGKCVSHGLTFADGRKCTVGVILPATLSFTTDAPEVMEATAGECEYRLAGQEAWSRCGTGQKFSVPAQTRFEIRVSGEPFSYICHFG